MHYLSRRVPETLAMCAVAIALVGCGSSNAPKPTGSMTVVITAVDGTTPAAVISGPNAYSKTISTSQTLSGLAVGSYTIVADSAVGPDSVVGTITDTGSVTGSPAAVAVNATANVTVAYARKHRLGGLWIANNNYGTIPDLAANQLRKSGQPVPAETLFTALRNPAGLALDASGNMWESGFLGDSLAMYTPAARNAGGGAAASIVILSTQLKTAENLTFDAHGNLWVANCGNHNLLEFTATQLATSGTQVPAVTIAGGAFVSCPWSLAFDANGNVWVADDGHNHIVEYSAAQLAASGTPTPVDTIGTNSGSLHATDGVAFDASGNLWVSNNSSNTVVEFTPAQLAAGGAPAPHTIITLPAGTIPFGIAFDKRGTLWVTDVSNGGTVYGLTGAQLAASGAPVPAVADTLTLTGSFGPEQPLFDPMATAVGVSTARVRYPTASTSQIRTSIRNGRRVTQ